jgi:hypothetical protein
MGDARHEDGHGHGDDADDGVGAVFGPVEETAPADPTVTAEDILDSFVSPVDLHKRIGDPTLPERLVRRIALEHPDERARLSAVEHPSCSGATLAAAARDISSTVRTAVAGHPRTPADALGALLTDTDRTVALAAARNPSTTPAARVALARSGDPHLMMMAATGPLTTAGIDVLLITGDREVRAAVARRDDLVLGHLTRLCEDPIVEVRLALAERLGRDHRADPHALRRLASDHDPTVRAAVAGDDTRIATGVWR